VDPASGRSPDPLAAPSSFHNSAGIDNPEKPATVEGAHRVLYPAPHSDVVIGQDRVENPGMAQELIAVRAGVWDDE
jgi:hypothetical protein